MVKHPLYILGGLSRSGKSEVVKKIKAQNSSFEIFHIDAFRTDGTNETGWLRVIKHLEDNVRSATIIEGVAANPQNVNALSMDNFFVKKAIFVGFGDEQFSEVLRSHALKNPDDHLRNEGWVFEKPNSENAKNWMRRHLKASEKLKQDAKDLNFSYLGLSGLQTDDERSDAVIGLLLG